MQAMATEEVPRPDKEEPENEKCSDISTVLTKIEQDDRVMAITESLKNVLTLPTPAGLVRILFYIASAGAALFFLLLLYHTWGVGALTSDSSEDKNLEKSMVIFSVCSAQVSHALTQLVIVVLVIITTSGAGVFFYIYDQKRAALKNAIAVASLCQEIVKDRNHVIYQLVAKQAMDMSSITHLEKENKQLKKVDK